MNDDLNKKSVVELLSAGENENQEYIDVIDKKIKEEIEIEENKLLIYLFESEVYYSFATSEDKSIELKLNLEFYTFEKYAELVNRLPFNHPAKIIWNAIKYKIKDEYRFNEYIAQIKERLEAYGYDRYNVEIESINSEESIDIFCRSVIYDNIEPVNDDDKISNNQKVEEDF